MNTPSHRAALFAAFVAGTLSDRVAATAVDFAPGSRSVAFWHQTLPEVDVFHSRGPLVTISQAPCGDFVLVTLPPRPFWHPALPTVRVSTQVGFKGRRLVVSCLAPSLDPHCEAEERPTAWAMALRKVSSIPVASSVRSGEASWS